MQLGAKIISFSSFVNVCVTLSVYWGMLKAKVYNDTKELNRSDVGVKNAEKTACYHSNVHYDMSFSFNNLWEPILIRKTYSILICVRFLLVSISPVRDVICESFINCTCSTYNMNQYNVWYWQSKFMNCNKIQTQENFI